MFRLITTLLTLVLCSGSIAQTVYKCEDDKGRRVFTDQPCRDGETVTFEAQNIVKPSLTTPVIPEASTEEESIEYQIEITAPSEEQTVPPGQQTLAISTNISPAPPAGTHYILHLNGQPTAQSSVSNFILRDLIRGEYKLSVEAIDTEGLSLGQSATRTIYVQRASVNNNTPALPASTGANSIR